VPPAAKVAVRERKRTIIDAARVLARLTRIVERACSDGGLSLPQYRLLLLVSGQSQRAGELASRAAVTRPAITDAVDGLERAGFLKRVPVEGDRRAVNLELTDAGAEAVNRAEESLTARLERLGISRSVLDGLASVGAVLDRELERQLRKVETEVK
jgi:DNA-binding MarR family transcriptional regulator